MAPRIIDCEQGTPEWFAARAGLPTASMFATVMAKGEGKTRNKYMRVLAGEIVTGQVVEGYRNTDMNRGSKMEAEIRRQYAFDRDVVPVAVGFMVNGRKGYSPDSVIDDRGLVEVKSKIPDLLIECLILNRFPPDHKAQAQGGLWVAEREWIDIAIGWLPDDRDRERELPLFVKRAYRDEPYIKNLSGEVDRFNDELDAVVERIRRYGQAEARAA